MHRFLMGSVVAAVIGLLLAGAGYWAYWNLYSRFQPITVSRNAGEVQRLLDEASWLSDGGGGQPLYIVAYRDSAATLRYLRDEAPKLKAAGVETRLILFARSDADGASRSTAAERATVAELWLSRDWPLYERWMATPSRSWTAAGLARADGDLARTAVVEAGRRFDEQLSRLLRDSGVRISYPLILWRDRDGALKACGCGDSRAWAFIRDDVGAPDRLGATPEPDTEAYAVQAAPQGGTVLPYPDLAIRPPEQAPGAGWADQSPDQDQAPPAARPGTPGRSAASPRPAPQPSRQDDATFY